MNSVQENTRACADSASASPGTYVIDSQVTVHRKNYNIALAYKKLKLSHYTLRRRLAGEDV
jgi:hypothetical protein